VPSRTDVGKVIVTEDVVTAGAAPTMVPRESEAKKKKSA
jgi:ATP-dependent Clp protease ATP-binding subunit ClpX